VSAVAAPRPVVAAAPAAPPLPDFIACADRKFFEILETYQHRSRPLNDYVTWDGEEEERLKQLRIESYQQRNSTDYKPHDVFHIWPHTRVNPEHVIKRVQLKKDAPKALPEFSHVMHVHVVSDRVMKAITALEEGRHAFYPLDVMAEGGTSYPYHFMQFLEHTDCTIPARGGFRKGVRQDGTSYWVRNSGDEKVSLDIERIGPRHLLHDKRAKSGCFISGELAAKLGDFLPRGYYLAEADVVRKRSTA
jgi:hypothetical protein